MLYGQFSEVCLCIGNVILTETTVYRLTDFFDEPVVQRALIDGVSDVDRLEGKGLTKLQRRLFCRLRKAYNSCISPSNDFIVFVPFE